MFDYNMKHACTANGVISCQLMLGKFEKHQLLRCESTGQHQFWRMGGLLAQANLRKSVIHRLDPSGIFFYFFQIEKPGFFFNSPSEAKAAFYCSFSFRKANAGCSAVFILSRTCIFVTKIWEIANAWKHEQMLATDNKNWSWISPFASSPPSDGEW